MLLKSHDDVVQRKRGGPRTPRFGKGGGGHALIWPRDSKHWCAIAKYQK
jgi:hypothetical protein